MWPMGTDLGHQGFDASAMEEEIVAQLRGVPFPQKGASTKRTSLGLQGFDVLVTEGDTGARLMDVALMHLVLLPARMASGQLVDGVIAITKQLMNKSLNEKHCVRRSCVLRFERIG